MEKGVNAIQQRSGKKKRIWIKRVLAMMAIVFFCVNGGTIVAKDRADNIIEGQNSGKNNITAPNTGGDISVMGHYESEKDDGGGGLSGGGSGGGGSSGGSHNSGGGSSGGSSGGGSNSGGESSGGSHNSGGSGSSGGGGGSSGGSHNSGSGGGNAGGSSGNSGSGSSGGGSTGGGSNSGSGSGGSHNSGGDTSGGGNSGGESETDTKEDAEKENDKKREETKDEAERIERDEKEAEERNKSRDKEDVENNAQQQAQSNSAQAGDPVRITSGTYVLEEEELGVIKRSYTSGKKGSGRIGPWWVSNLDERIIHSVDRHAPEFCKAADENKRKAEQSYNEAESIEKSYAAQWGEAIDEEYLGEIRKHRDSIRGIYEQAAQLYERYRLLTALNKYSVNSETPEYYWGCGNEKLVFVDVEGFPNIYEPSGKGVWTPIDKGKQQYSRIESRDGNGAESEAGFILYEKGGVKKYFNKWGLLERIEYSPYENMTFIRNEKQQAVRIEMPHHQEYRLKYTEEGLLSSISNRAGQTVKYGYENGSLVSVTDETGDEVRYAYSASGLLEKIIKPDGSAITIVYGESDAEGNVYVTATEDEEGNRESFEYHRDEKYTVHKNHSGIVESIRYDDKHRTVKEEKAA